MHIPHQHAVVVTLTWCHDKLLWHDAACTIPQGSTQVRRVGSVYRCLLYGSVLQRYGGSARCNVVCCTAGYYRGTAGRLDVTLSVVRQCSTEVRRVGSVYRCVLYGRVLQRYGGSARCNVVCCTAGFYTGTAGRLGVTLCVVRQGTTEVRRVGSVYCCVLYGRVLQRYGGRLGVPLCVVRQGSTEIRRVGSVYCCVLYGGVLQRYGGSARCNVVCCTAGFYTGTAGRLGVTLCVVLQSAGYYRGTAGRLGVTLCVVRQGSTEVRRVGSV